MIRERSHRRLDPLVVHEPDSRPARILQPRGERALDRSGAARAEPVRARFDPGVAALALLSCGSGAAYAQSGEQTLPAVVISAEQVRPDGSLGLDEPTEVGSRLGISARETPASTSSMTSAEMEDRGIFRLQDAVVRLPGMSSAAHPGNGGTQLSARGFTGLNSVVQMIDGTRLVVGSGTISFPFSTWPYESVEVLRGPSSVLYGDGAIGGAVNYVTKQPLLDRRENEAFLSAGSQDTVQAGIGSRGPITDSLAYAAYLSGDTSDGYIDKTDYSTYTYSATLLFSPVRQLRLALSADGSHQDNARYRGTPVNNGVLDPRLRRTNFNVSDSDLTFDDHWYRFKAAYDVSDRVTLRNVAYYLTSERHFRDVQNFNYTPTGQIQRSRYVDIVHEQHQSGNRFDAVIDSNLGGLKNRSVIGFEYYHTDFLHNNNTDADGRTFSGVTIVDPFNFSPGLFTDANTRPTIPRARTTLDTTALFAENALDLTPQWKLVAGLRSDRMELEATDVLTGATFPAVYKPVTGRAGAVWSPSRQLSLYGQYATATDPASALLNFFAAPKDVELTKGKQWELGAKGSLPEGVRGEWTVAAYRIEKTDLLGIDPVSGLTQHVGKQSSQGVELAIAVQPAPGWLVDANVAALRAQFDDFFEKVGTATVSRAGNLPPNTPERLANLWTHYRFAPQWQVGFGVQYVGARQGNNANTTPVPSYTLLDASLRHEVSRNLNLSLLISNLADKTYAVFAANNGAQWQLGAPRRFDLVAHARF